MCACVYVCVRANYCSCFTIQMLQFEPYKDRGQIFLSQEHTSTLVEQLEDSQTTVSSMLMLKHMMPMRQRASDWVFKLASINEILQQWMIVQNLWHNLEAVFSNMDFAKVQHVQAHMHIHTYVTHVHVCAHMHTHIHTCTHTCACTLLSVQILLY